jgi:predicted enzyme related to lactoylglutathione lyase
MRSVILVLMTTMTLMTSSLHAEERKGPKPDVGAGHIAWFDITTSDMARAKEFYGKLFDWHFTALKGTDLAAEIVAGDTPIGTLRVAEGKISGYNGVVYVQAPDIQAICKKAKDLGGTLIPGFPFNLPDNKGSIGLVLDPIGHPIGIYSRTPFATKPAPAK